MRLACLALCAAALAAQPLPRWEHLSSSTGDLPSPGPSPQQTGSLACDVDNDGDDDFFVATRVVGPALTLLLRTAGGWTKHIPEPDFLRIEAGGACHDIDSDGDLDIVFGADAGDNRVWWWENPHPALSPAKRWPRRLIKSSGANKHHDQLFGDFDGDGQAELVAWNQRARQLLLYDVPANPRDHAVWTPNVIYRWSGPEHEGLAAADIDSDGVLDIVGGGRWYQHAGDGKFTAHVIDDAYRFSRAAAGQLVAGGPPEVVFAPGDVNGPMRWFERKGGRWVAHELPRNDLIHGHSIGVGDVNQDGFDDILSAEMGQWGTRMAARNYDARMRVFYGDGRGGFTEQLVSRGFGNHETRLADLDGDGDLDILSKPYNWRTPRIDVWLNHAPSDPTLPLERWRRHVIDAAKPWRAVFILPGDLDGDGFADLAAGGWWYRNPGSAGGDWRRREFGSPLRNVAAVHDFDQDGDLDVLGTQGEGSVRNPNFVWAQNDGAGNFELHHNVPRGQGDFLQGAAAGRFFDEHRRPSVALSWHRDGGGVQLLTPGAGWWTWRRISPFTQQEQLSVADIDRDGDADLFTGTHWLRNDGGRFTNVLANPSAGLPDRNRLADINGDGRLDAVVGYESSRAPGKLAWYEQPLRAESEWPERLIAELVGPMSLDVADMDRDGDIDVIVGQHNLADPSASALLIFENTGDGWVRHQVHTGDEHHDGAQVVDLDNDGDLDIVSLGWTHANVLVYENLARSP